jgi:hypothetical protein
MDGSESDKRLPQLYLLWYQIINPAHLYLVKVITRFSQPAFLRKKWLDEKDRCTGKCLGGGGGAAMLVVKMDAKSIDPWDCYP